MKGYALVCLCLLGSGLWFFSYPKWLGDSREFFPEIHLQRLTLFYVIGEQECITCVEQLKSFIELLDPHKDLLDQRVILLSPERSDRRDYGPMLGLPCSIQTGAPILEATCSQGIGPMMYLLTPAKRLVFARLISGMAVAPNELKNDIVQLCYQIEQR